MSGSSEQPNENGPSATPIRAALRARLRHVVSRGHRKSSILDALVAGVTCNHAIGQHMGIAPETVKRHFTQLFERTGIHDRVFLAVLWGEVRREDREGGAPNGGGVNG